MDPRTVEGLRTLGSRVWDQVSHGVSQYYTQVAPSAPPMDSGDDHSSSSRVSDDPIEIARAAREQGLRQRASASAGATGGYYESYAQAEGVRDGERHRCPCGASLLLEEWDAHRAHCEHATVPCEFAAFGCKAVVARGSMQAHNRSYFAYHRDLLSRAGSVWLSPAANRQQQPQQPVSGAVSASDIYAPRASNPDSNMPGMGRAAPVGLEMSHDRSRGSASMANILGDTAARRELYHNCMAVADAAEQFFEQVASSGRQLAHDHLHMRNANQALAHLNTFLSTDRIHPLGKVGIAGVSLLVAKGFIFMFLRWSVLWFLCMSAYSYIDSSFPRIPSSMGREGSDVVAFNERRTLALVGYGILVVWLFVTIM